MFELDHMLNGVESRNHLEELAEQARLEKLAREAEVAEHEYKEQHPSTPRRTVFSSAVLLLTRWG